MLAGLLTFHQQCVALASSTIQRLVIWITCTPKPVHFGDQEKWAGPLVLHQALNYCAPFLF